MSRNGNRTRTRGATAQALLRYAIPIVLIAVAGIQQVSVRTAHLSPWKGGGFGMFSTVDDPRMRTVDALVIRNGEPVVVALDAALGVHPELDRHVRRARYVPTARNLNTLARELSGLPWRLAENERRSTLEPLDPEKEGAQPLTAYGDVLRIQVRAMRMQRPAFSVSLVTLYAHEVDL